MRYFGFFCLHFDRFFSSSTFLLVQERTDGYSILDVLIKKHLSSNDSSLPFPCIPRLLFSASSYIVPFDWVLLPPFPSWDFALLGPTRVLGMLLPEERTNERNNIGFRCLLPPCMSNPALLPYTSWFSSWPALLVRLRDAWTDGMTETTSTNSTRQRCLCGAGLPWSSYVWTFGRFSHIRLLYLGADLGLAKSSCRVRCLPPLPTACIPLSYPLASWCSSVPA